MSPQVRGAHEPRNRAAACPARPVNDVAWRLIVPEVELGVFSFCRACRHGIRPFHVIRMGAWCFRSVSCAQTPPSISNDTVAMSEWKCQRKPCCRGLRVWLAGQVALGCHLAAIHHSPPVDQAGMLTLAQSTKLVSCPPTSASARALLVSASGPK